MRFLSPVLLLSCLLIPVASVQAVSSSMAQTGFSGILRVPHAESLPFGDFSINYQWEDNIDYDTCYGCGAHKTVLMGVGLLPGLEFTVQNTHKLISDGPGWSGTHSSDLSFSAKYDFKPFLPEQWFSFALGVQDYGGAASKHRNLYGVASKEFFADTPYDLRLTAGYGQGDARNQMGSDYLQGAFAGIEWQPFSWLQLVSDYDGTGVNGGFKLLSAENWLPYGWQANFSYQLYSGSVTANRDNQWMGLGLTLPLAVGSDAKRYTREGVDEFYQIEAMPEQQIKQQVAADKQKQGKQLQANIPSLSALEQKDQQNQQSELLLKILVDYGFENVRIGWRETTLVVSLENNLFNWNELDGLGVALGLIVDNSDAQSFEFHLLNNQIAVLKVTGKSKTFRDYLHQKSDQAVKTHGLTISNQVSALSDVTWYSQRQASGNFVPRFIFSPHLRSAMGTEFGVFDYSLALSSNLQISLWSGGVVDVRHLLPVAHSDSYDDGEYFANARHKSEVDRILFHQAFALPGAIMTQFSAGQIYKSYRGVLNETRWESATGTHRIKTEVGDFRHENNDYSYRPVLAAYRYYLRGLDLAVEGRYGQHWSGDLGGSLSLKKWFGDMSVNLTYQNTSCDRSKREYSCSADGYAEKHEYAGLTFQFPFGTRKNSAPTLGLQIKTLEQWGYGYRSRINNHANYIGGNRGGASNLQYNVDQQYFNRDRLSKSYIESNMQRLRESYSAYAH
ncbi:MAG: hypothetical protein ACJAT7_001010 [Psychromonas sp.]|jgi:hypothetical protein|uniref:YjbH domain-containing protein n=1 Tax=Psychromonas sp. TaxID=1884585 RepID=UPI0039E58FA9